LQISSRALRLKVLNAEFANTCQDAEKRLPGT
jgi:hypothetical protein